MAEIAVVLGFVAVGIIIAAVVTV